MNRFAIVLFFLAPSVFAFDCKQVDVAELQLMTQEELVSGFCLNTGYKGLNANLMSIQAGSLRNMQREAVADWENCRAVTMRYNLVHRDKFGSELSDQTCEDIKAKKVRMEAAPPASARSQMTKQQRLDELKTLSLTYEEYQRRYREIMALPD